LEPIASRPRRLPLPDFIHHRSLLVNCYPAVGKAQPRLDFSYYEYPDVGRFVEARRPGMGAALAAAGVAVGRGTDAGVEIVSSGVAVFTGLPCNPS
jgi:hypothetical protein